MNVVVAGASGFVGRALGALNPEGINWTGLSRRAGSSIEGYTEIRSCDLFSRGDAVQALQGADMAVYLVHSMMPSARLTQANFQDLDLLCALNFAEACEQNGVRKIVYLGGLLPESGDLSAHLESRREVEEALGSTGVPVIALRAGLVLGAEGSSFQIVQRLVERLPWMICPSWTQTRTQPTHLDDVTEAIVKSLQDDALEPGSYDLGVETPISYLELLRVTSEKMGVKRRFWTVPVFSARLSRRWVCVTTGTPFALVAPLIESLREPMLVAPDRRFPLGRPPRSLHHALDDALGTASVNSVATPSLPASSRRKAVRKSLVRSVQRMTMPEGKAARWVAKEYLAWLPTTLQGLIKVENPSEEEAKFIFRPLGLTLLILSYAPTQSTQRRALFKITGGLLARGDGPDRFEFRLGTGEGSLLTAVHDFSPRLPWWLYRQTQARFHLHVMGRFSRHLFRISKGRSASMQR